MPTEGYLITETPPLSPPSQTENLLDSIKQLKPFVSYTNSIDKSIQSAIRSQSVALLRHADVYHRQLNLVHQQSRLLAARDAEMQRRFIENCESILRRHINKFADMKCFWTTMLKALNERFKVQKQLNEAYQQRINDLKQQLLVQMKTRRARTLTLTTETGQQNLKWSQPYQAWKRITATDRTLGENPTLPCIKSQTVSMRALESTKKMKTQPDSSHFMSPIKRSKEKPASQRKLLIEILGLARSKYADGPDWTLSLLFQQRNWDRIIGNLTKAPCGQSQPISNGQTMRLDKSESKSSNQLLRIRKRLFTQS